MRFLLHGDLAADIPAALAKHEHAVHALAELAESAQAEVVSDPAVFLGLLQQKQWHLLTTDAALVQQIYEQKINFPGIMVLLLDPPAQQTAAIDRLFERYPRLSARRLYTVTPNRVKIRQLPGAAQA